MYVLLFLLFLRCSAQCSLSSFEELDQNGDGIVTSDEFSDACSPTRSSRRPASKATLDDVQTVRKLKLSDSNKAAASVAVQPRVLPKVAGGGVAKAHKWHQPWIQDQFTVGEDDELVSDRDARRLAYEDHDDVPTDVSAANSTIEAEWADDFEVLKPILTRRGYNVSSARTLCELPRVYCDYGYRRRVPIYAKDVMGGWVGSEYQFLLPVLNESIPAIFDPGIFDLKRVGMLEVEVSAGPMPPGVERLTRLTYLSIDGTGSGGLEGPLPEGFWSARTRFFSLTNHGAKFTGRLEADLPICKTLDERLYLYEMPSFTGDIEALAACKNIKNTISIWGVPKLTGNAWAAALGMGTPAAGLWIGMANFSGQVPFAEDAPDNASSPWVQWCQAAPSSVSFWIQQDVMGSSLPRGLAACGCKFSAFDVSSSGFTGHFPLNFSTCGDFDPVGLLLYSNMFSGPIPEIPWQTTDVGLAGNAWVGDIPKSWYNASGLMILDLSFCGMQGAVVNITPFMTKVVLSGNRFNGFVPESWRLAKLKFLDLSNNEIRGPPFAWGWQSLNPYTNANSDTIASSYVPPPKWPLTFLDLSNNPLGINVGFLMGMSTYYFLEEFRATNCLLSGYVTPTDLSPWVPVETGGSSSDLTVGAYMQLVSLDLSRNGLVCFGYDAAACSRDVCWDSTVGEASFPKLKQLALQGCEDLIRVHPWVYSLERVDLRGTSKLQPPPFANTSQCSQVFVSEAADCAGMLQRSCFFTVPLYNLVSMAEECADLGVITKDGRRPTIQVKAQQFAPEELCRCLPGFERRAGECVPCGVGFYRSLAMASCAACPEPSISVLEVATSVFDCKCPAGSFMYSSVCEACPEHTYSAVVGAVSLQTCVKCPPGTVTSSAGAGDLHRCTCPSGYTVVSNASQVCEPCCQGFHKEVLGDEPCAVCPKTLGGTQLTTQMLASAHQTDCVCPAGTYAPLSQNQDCLRCPSGMLCGAVNTTEAAIPFPGTEVSVDHPSPGAAPGFMTLLHAPMTPYKCFMPFWCPGGPPGTCGLGRDASVVGCGACPVGFYSQGDGSCEACKMGAMAALMVSAMTGGMVALTLIVVVVDRSVAMVPQSSITVVVVSSLTITATQTLGVLTTLSVSWPEPLSSFLRAISMLSFNLELLRTECLVGQHKAQSFALRQIVGPISALYIAAVIIVKRRLFGKDSQLFAPIVNAFGAIYQAFFVSVLVSTTLPWICYDHPNGLGSSMQSDPGILCFQGGQHATMQGWSIGSLIVNVLPFLVMVAWAIFRYRRVVGANDATALKHLVMFRFLFFRFKPECYYYSAAILARSVLICLAPVVARNSSTYQVMSISCIFLFFQCLQLQLQPWRSRASNIADAVLSSAMVLLMVCVSMCNDFNDATSVIGVLGAIVVCLVFLFAALVLGVSIYKRFMPSTFFKFFICHHKADAGTQSRYLQLIIRASGDSCFLDSDDLKHLDDLLDLVRQRIGHLAVFRTGQTLQRPWCAAEVATTFDSHKRIAVLRTASAAHPWTELDADSIKLHLHASDVNLLQYGLTWNILAMALNWVCSGDVPRIEVNEDFLGLARLQDVADQLKLLNKSWVRSQRTAAREDQLKAEMLIISSQDGSHEATAAAGIVAFFLKTRVMEFVRNGIGILANSSATVEAKLVAVREAHSVLFILCKGSLQCPQQLKMILAACDSDEMPQAISITLPDFRFPDAEYYTALVNTPHDTDRRLAEALPGFFRRIGVPLATKGSEKVLSAQCSDIFDRLPRRRVREKAPVMLSLSVDEISADVQVEEQVPRTPKAALFKPVLCETSM